MFEFEVKVRDDQSGGLFIKQGQISGLIFHLKICLHNTELYHLNHQAETRVCLCKS